MIAALLLAQAAAAAPPSVADVEGLLPPADSNCLYGANRRTGRGGTICPILAPHVHRMECREAADLGGYVCDYSVQYADYQYQIGINSEERRSDLFARSAEPPAGWRLVREITPPNPRIR